ncbi:hypothetical protein [Luteimonas sp. MC1828]|uniref:hypothetical protein n=1 Tax=Luteimonas sp. MC1828 TaxID=2799787 RepID=UPI0018F10AEF|nr:hypothetical protein [Luteimonas sp. MC1828]MBJ7574672.1 hypothetical protein [Luteimonas sp. MC1828]
MDVTALQQEFYDTISNYDYFARSGRMDVEEHAHWAHIAMHLDGIWPAPQPEAIFNLLLSLANEATEVYESPPVEQSRFKDGLPYDEAVHPGGSVTLLHIATAIRIFDRYIFCVGGLLDCSPTDPVPQSGFWIDPGWCYTAAFFDGFQRCISNHMLSIDEKDRQERGYSLLEVMNLGKERLGADVEALLARHSQVTDTWLDRMAAALATGAFVEAVSAQQRLLEMLMQQTLEVFSKPRSDRLVDLVAAAKELDEQQAWATPESF